MRSTCSVGSRCAAASAAARTGGGKVHGPPEIRTNRGKPAGQHILRVSKFTHRGPFVLGIGPMGPRRDTNLGGTARATLGRPDFAQDNCNRISRPNAGTYLRDRLFRSRRRPRRGLLPGISWPLPRPKFHTSRRGTRHGQEEVDIAEELVKKPGRKTLHPTWLRQTSEESHGRRLPGTKRCIDRFFPSMRLSERRRNHQVAGGGVATLTTQTAFPSPRPKHAKAWWPWAGAARGLPFFARKFSTSIMSVFPSGWCTHAGMVHMASLS